MKKLFLFFYVCVSVLLNFEVYAGAPISDENNLIKNGHFNNLTLGFPDSWGFWSLNGGAAPVIQDGVAICSPIATPNIWEYIFYQTGLEALPNIPYIFSFRAWSDADRSIGVTFQDSPENNYNRYGSSSDPEAIWGSSEWNLNVSTEPTTYTLHVVFDKMVPTTMQFMQFMLNATSDVVYIDDISLIKVEDLPVLKVSENSTTLSASEGSSTKLLLTTTANWTAVSDQSWLSVYPTSGTGDNTLILNAEANPSLETRTASVTVSASGFPETETITVTQEGSKAPIIVTAGSLASAFSPEQLATLTKLTLTGTIDARDFKTMRDDMPNLAEIDLSGVNIVEYTGKEGTGGTNSLNYPSNTVPYMAFRTTYGNNSLSTVILPSTIISIGMQAFHYCRGLTSINIPSSVVSIESIAFGNCTEIPYVKIPSSVISIGSYAFGNWSGLIDVDENNPNFSSNEGVLYNKTKTTLIQCPTSKVGSFQIPSSVNSLDIYAFSNCIGLTSINIPKSVTTFGTFSMSICYGLTSIKIPEFVNYIGLGAFAYCKNVSSIYAYPFSPVDISTSSRVFEEINKTTCILYVPFGTKAAYQVANQWQDFENIVEMSGFQLSATTINIGATQGSPITVDLTSNTDWTATSDQTWLTVAPTAGTGNQTLTFTANANPQSTSRTATVTVSATGVEPQTISVTQASLTMLTVSAESVVIGASAKSTNTFKITSSIDWTAASNQSWLTLQPSSFVNSSLYAGTYYASGVFMHPTSGNRFFNNKEEILTMLNDVTVQKDYAGDYPFKTQIQITNNTIIVDGKTMIKVNVTIPDPANSTGSGMLDTDQNGNATNYFDPSTRTYNLSYYYNTTVNRKIYEVLAGSSNTSTITLTAAENPTSSIRHAAITITANGIPDIIVNVAQDASPVLAVSTNSLEMAAEANSIISFNVQSTTGWTISGNQDWLSVSKTEGSNNETILLTASSNQTSEARNATITVTATGGATQTINVLQFGIVTVSGKWNQFFHGQSYTDLSIVDENVIWSAGPSGTTISYTIDGGKTWTTKNLPTELSGKTGGFSAVSATTAYIICSSGATPGLYKTTDGANTWTLESTGFSSNNPTNFYGLSFPDFVYFWDTDNGLAYGDDNEIYTTSNGGAQWVHASSPELRCGTGNWSVNSQSVYKVIGNTIYILVGAQANSHGRILKSTDKGLTWSSITPPANTMSASFDFKDDNNGLYVNYFSKQSKLYSTTDGGQSWTSINSSEDLRYLKYIPNQNIYISNNLVNGLMYSMNNGQTWITHPSFGNIRTFNDVFSFQGITYMSGSGYVYSSQNIAGVNTSFDQAIIKSPTSIDLKFSNNLELKSSNDVANYVITYTTGNTVESINIVSALRDDQNQALVHLITQSALPLGTITISVSNVYDLNGYPLINGSTSSTQTLVIKLLLSATSVDIGYADGSTASVSVTPNISWTASSDQSWLSISPASGTDNQTLTFTAEENTSRSTRSAVVTVSAIEFESQTVTVTQDGSNAPVAVTAGGLASVFTPEELASITKLTLTGTIDARDFKTMRDDMPLLAEIDLSGVSISEYDGTEGTLDNSIFYPANEVPQFAFYSLNTYSGKIGMTSITLPTSTSSIGYYAFQWCTGLVTFTIPASVTLIYDGAFFGFAGEFIVDPANLNYSDNDGILFNKNQTTILKCPTSKSGNYTIPSSVSSIGHHAFFGCYKLTTLTIPSLVKTIETNAFFDCSGLTSIYAQSSFPVNLSNSIDVFLYVDKTNCILYVPYGAKIAYQASGQWQDFTNIVEASEGFSLSASTVNFAAAGGSASNVDLSANVVWTVSSDQTWLTVNPSSGNDNETLTFTAEANPSIVSRKVTVTVSATGFDSQTITVTQDGLNVPVNVTAGGLKALFTTEELNSITKLTLTGTIDARDFKTMRDNMPLLAELDLSAVTIAEYIGAEGTYWEVGAIITYPANEIPIIAFRNQYFVNTSLTSVILPENATSIGWDAFCLVVNLKSIIIPPTITKIDVAAFSQCPFSTVTIPSSVTFIGVVAFSGSNYINVEPDNPNYCSIDGVLFNKTKTTLMQCPYSKTGSYTIPPTVTKIDDHAFEYCRDLTSVEIPSSVTSISHFAFLGCISLTSITNPSQVTYLGDWAFSDCSGLTSIYSQTLVPVNLSNSKDVFLNVDKTNCTLYVPYGTKTLYEAANLWTDFENIVEAGDGFLLSASTASVGAAEGSTCTADITANVEWSAVSDQGWLTVYPVSGGDKQTLTFTADANPSIVARQATVTVSAMGFDSQTVTVTQQGSNVPVSVTAGGLKDLFTTEELNSITKLNLTGTIDARDFKTMRDDMPLLAELNLMAVTIAAYAGPDGTSIWGNENYPADAIPEFAFMNSTWQGKTNLTSLTLPATITVLGQFSIGSCSGLTYILIPSSVSTLAMGVFQNCQNLSSIYFPSSIKTIETQSFYSCGSLSKVFIPETVTSIGDRAFANGVGFISVDINNPNYSSIDGVLYNKDQTTILQCPVSKAGAYIIPSSVISIGQAAFEGCSQLTSVDIPFSVQLIDYNAFWACRGLTELSIPYSVNTIRSDAFGYCTGLSSITVSRSVPLDLNKYVEVFYNIDNSKCTLLVPYGSKAAYQTANQWQDFTNIVEATEGFSLSASSVSMQATGGSIANVELLANVDWTASSDQTWLTVSPTSGNGNQTLTFTAEANPFYTDRTAIVYISAIGFESQTINVLQVAMPYKDQIAVIKKTETAPVIDGTVDEVWNIANSNNIERPYIGENPTLGNTGATTWKALWNNDGIYILLQVTDNIFSPAYAGTDPNQNWMYDKPEIYFDVNLDKKDGLGAASDGNGNGSGHYQFAPTFNEAEIGGDIASDIGSNGAIYSFKVTIPNYVGEYFIPFSKLIDKNGAEVDKESPIGFDISIADNDITTPNRNRAVWSNTGQINENWFNMDDAGTLTLEGAEPSVLITQINLADGTITADNGTLQMNADILPADATNKHLLWTVENVTGRATINPSTGLLTAQLDGTVTVKAMSADGSQIQGTATVTISGQDIQISDLELIKNGNFISDGGLPSPWGWWTNNGALEPKVVDGVAVCSPLQGTYVWEYQFNQSGLEALPNTDYVFSFTAWSDAERIINVDFEDTPANGYNRYGYSSDPESNGRSDWTFGITTLPTVYTFHVNFDQILPTTIQKVQFMLASTSDVVYLDHVSLISAADIILVNKAPTANAGTDQSVNERTLVTLNGSASTDPDNDNLSYKWTAPIGIVLSSEIVAQPSFTAPSVMTDTDLTFSLVVNDGKVDSPGDQVVIKVIQIDEAPIADAGPDQTVYEGDLVTLEGAIALNQPILKRASVGVNNTFSSSVDTCPIDYQWSIPADATFDKTTVTRLTFTGPEIATVTDHLITLEIIDESNPDNQGNALKFQWPIPAGVTLSSTIIARITIVNPKNIEDKKCTFSLMVYDGSTSTEPNATTVVYVNISPTEIPLISTTNVKLSVTSPEVTLPVDYTYSMLVYDGSGSADPNNGATIYLSIPPTPIKLGSPTVGKLIIKAPTDQTDPNYDFLLAVCTDSESPDPDEEELIYHWFAPEGIELLSETENKATFIAPEVDVDTDYTFRLMVNNGKADSQSDEVLVTVRNRNSAPLANAGNDLTVNEGSPVTLDGKYSSDPDNDVLNYIWIAPDGIEISSDSESNLIFVGPEVNEDTEFIFSLIVSDGMLNSEIDEIIVTVKQVHKAPTAKAGFDQTANEGTLVTLDGSASFVVDGAELKYKWTAPEGIMLISETDKISTFIAPEVSTDTQYTFSLIVNDGKAESTIDEVVITVLQLNKVPFADAGFTQSVEEGTMVLLDGTASSDPDGDILIYKWTSPVGIVLNSDSDPNPSFTAPEVSADTQYTFYLEVNDGKTTSPTVEVVIEVLDINVKGAAEISGYVYEDTNNGTKSMSIIKSTIDHGKPFEGAFIQLFKSGETTPIATTQTDLNGFYRFDHLEIAEYGIVVEIPGFIQSEKFRVVVSEQEPLISVKFLVNTNTGSITDVNPILLSSVKIYPNPTKGRVQLKFNQIPVTGTWISVYDASGSLILKSPALDLEESINLEGNPAGLYFIKLGEKSSKTYKLVLE